jgi:integrase
MATPSAWWSGCWGGRLSASSVRNALMPLRVIYRRALREGLVAASPLTHLELPAVRGRRERIASPAEAAALLATLPENDRAIWATAIYAGLRRGELMALRVEDVDLVGGVVAIERAWDAKAGVLVAVKSRAGRRRVPITGELRRHLVAHLLRRGTREGLVFGRPDGRPFDPSSLRQRADQAWKAADLGRLTLHECRHTFASIAIAAGVNAKALSDYLGHSSIQTTFDRYGHLMPGSEDVAAGLIDAYLSGARAGA